MDKTHDGQKGQHDDRDIEDRFTGWLHEIVPGEKAEIGFAVPAGKARRPPITDYSSVREPQNRQRNLTLQADPKVAPKSPKSAEAPASADLEAALFRRLAHPLASRGCDAYGRRLAAPPPNAS